MRHLSFSIAIGLTACLITVSDAKAGLISTLYGDNDGFGIGLTSGTGLDPVTSHADATPFTDVRLIGSFFSAGPFAPTGSFDPFSVAGTITSVTLTLRTGNWGGPLIPADEVTNHIFLNGLMIPDTFLAGFSDSSGNGGVETRTFDLDSSFFPSLALGNASLNGSYLSQGNSSEGGSFQVDFLQLDIVTDAAVPEPATFGLIGAGLGALGLLRRRFSLR